MGVDYAIGVDKGDCRVHYADMGSVRVTRALLLGTLSPEQRVLLEIIRSQELTCPGVRGEQDGRADSPDIRVEEAQREA